MKVFYIEFDFALGGLASFSSEDVKGFIWGEENKCLFRVQFNFKRFIMRSS